ncbi:cob(I)yrinic acid a,c-diamide adenosyltransferase [Robiginitalea sp. M366]|uniref:cob(I)yrinic acid a,c-diamide adenosyltransferase n=1 Tax=Robiginitalea aestuariiviva TaxID=3036903 RepID=UPI00240CFF43|nr:cob(I)yrinic acid a,c-diamide adenosyltransferase [Robiginitalea aestuariiviva]MDG1572402.1 cob(I)yrinic acid a,c-diamide adenosyltransferase [Robiginitalea aestuariiviva]
MKIYTKTGDAGSTGLFGGTRVPKHHIRIQSYGTVDELNAWIGLLRDHAPEEGIHTFLQGVQDQLFTAGSMLATEPEKAELRSGKPRLNIPLLGEADIQVLETEIDRLNESLPPMTHFVLPGGHPAVSYCHIARTVCRRAERMTTLLHEQSPVDPVLLAYLNRLSDYLFVLARKLSAVLGADEIKWIPRAPGE